VLHIPSANCAKRKLETTKALLYSRILRWTTKEMKMQFAGVGQLRIPVVNKSVTAGVKKVEIEAAASS